MTQQGHLGMKNLGRVLSHSVLDALTSPPVRKTSVAPIILVNCFRVKPPCFVLRRRTGSAPVLHETQSYALCAVSRLNLLTRSSCGNAAATRSQAPEG
jgi:hypothetical protein